MSDGRRKIIDQIEERRRAAAARTSDLSTAPKKSSRWSMPFAGLHRAIVQFEPYGIILAVFGLIHTFGTIILDLEDQQSERIFKAWEILALDHENINNSSAKRQALEFLNREYEGLFCSATIVTPIVELLNGNQSRKCLILAKTQEGFPNLKAQNTLLYGAALPRANLSGADFAKANLIGADLRGANLIWANLTGAVLTEAEGLTEAQLISACGVPASLPPGLPTPPPCQE